MQISSDKQMHLELTKTLQASLQHNCNHIQA